MLQCNYIIDKGDVFMKEDLKNIFLMGLGAMSLTTEKAKALKNELLEKGNKLYEEGKVANTELKHNIESKLKENVTIVVNQDVTKDDILNKIKKMNEDEKKELLNALNQTEKVENE